jgi:phosphoserine phosphatase
MKLLVFDVEGTIFETKIRLPGTSIDSAIWQGIAHALGAEATREEVATHQKWKNGTYRSYLHWMEDTIAIHRRHSLSRDLFQTLIQSAEYNPGVAETLTQVNRSAYEILLVSGEFRELAERAQRDFKIVHAFASCEYFFDDRGRLAAYNLLPCDFEGKIDFIQLMLREYKLGSRDWLFVGDGMNDIAVAQHAPISVGYRSHPELRKVVTYAIDDFRELLRILDSLGDT